MYDMKSIGHHKLYIAKLGVAAAAGYKATIHDSRSKAAYMGIILNEKGMLLYEHYIYHKTISSVHIVQSPTNHIACFQGFQGFQGLRDKDFAWTT